MDRFNRICLLHNLLNTRRTPISLKAIMERLECSKSTADRDIETLRDQLNAPIEYDRSANGYIYNQQNSLTPYELPGLWFNTQELYGLLICQQILKDISPGILSEQIEGLKQRINKMLSRENSQLPVISEKIQFMSVGKRLQDDNHFTRIASALFSDKRIHIQYQARGRDNKLTERTISPQKIVHYRNNWYLAAFCHYRNDLRLFSIDRIQSTKITEESSQQLADDEIQRYINATYGIFSGMANHTAVLKFSKQRANWVADEHWHQLQQGKWLDNGQYQLSFPFSDSRELIMDILKHGAEVSVVSPPFLKEQIKQEIEKMKKIYD